MELKHMNKILGLAIMGLFISIPANAQRSMVGAPGPSASNGIGSTAVGQGGSGGGGGGTVAFHTLSAVAPTQFLMIDVSGVSGEFIPSSWIQFDKGLAEAQAQLAAQGKSLAEVAAEYRRTERARAKLTIIQDSVGNAVILRR
jgi:hypothetical protein